MSKNKYASGIEAILGAFGFISSAEGFGWHNGTTQKAFANRDETFFKVNSGVTNIAATANANVDSVPVSDVVNIEWHVNIVNTNTTTEYRAFKVYATYNQNDATVVAFTEFAQIGNFLDYTVNVTSNGTTITLNLTNNDASDAIDVRTFRANIS